MCVSVAAGALIKLLKTFAGILILMGVNKPKLVAKLELFNAGESR